MEWPNSAVLTLEMGAEEASNGYLTAILCSAGVLFFPPQDKYSVHVHYIYYEAYVG